VEAYGERQKAALEHYTILLEGLVGECHQHVCSYWMCMQDQYLCMVHLFGVLNLNLILVVHNHRSLEKWMCYIKERRDA
jgi:hypothetical protein